MAIDFPNSPNSGDTFSVGNVTWRWNGYAWNRVPDPGAKGEIGQKGDKGEVGLTGSIGQKGQKGDVEQQGNKGDTGAQGPQGAQGSTGDKGAKGDKGDTGPQGPQGSQGSQGQKGEIGNTGPAGPTGPQGLQGPTGPQGPIGPTGPQGDKGQKGASGTDGSIGPTGPQGQAGAPGTSGPPGPTGPQGPAGSGGSTGPTGPPGPSGSDASLPSGFIGLWSGAANAIPSGWYLCNGSNGTPDLRNRFVVGAGSSYNVGATGGSNSVTLTTSQIPSHTHGDGSYATNQATLTGNIRRISESFAGFGGSASGVFSKVGGFNTGGTPGSPDSNNCGGVNFNGSHTHDVSGSTSSASPGTNSQGSSASNANLPPYYALCYIMKA